MALVTWNFQHQCFSPCFCFSPARFTVWDVHSCRACSQLPCGKTIDHSKFIRSVTPWSKRRWKVDGHNSFGSRSYARYNPSLLDVRIYIKFMNSVCEWRLPFNACHALLQMMTWSGRHLSRAARQPPTTVPHPKMGCVGFLIGSPIIRRGFSVHSPTHCVIITKQFRDSL